MFNLKFDTMTNSEDFLIDEPLVINDCQDKNEIMWDILIDKIMDGEVVPVIGEKVVLEGDITVNQILINHITRKEGITCRPKSFSQLLFHDCYKSDRDLIYGTISRLITNNQDRFLPSSLLKRILSIRQFPFVITTSVDCVVENAMREIWNSRGRDLRKLVFNNNPKDVLRMGDISKDTDIEIPTIYYMFGKADNSKLHSFVVTDEDMLSFCQSWLTEDKRPKILSRVLGDKFLLFLGCTYPDWLVRFIWYSMRNNLEKSGMLVAEQLEETLSDFFKRVHVNTQKNPEFVIQEIEKRVSERMEAFKIKKFDTPQDRTDIFISYPRTDEQVAEELYNSLTAKGLNVWYDRKNLAVGDKWLEKINNAIKSTKFFVVILSKNIASQVNESHVYRKEWNMAIEHAKGMGGKRGFIIPVCIDDIDLYNNNLDLPDGLKSHNALSVKGDIPFSVAADCILERVNSLAK